MAYAKDANKKSSDDEDEDNNGDSDAHCWNHHLLDRSEGDLFLVLLMIFSTLSNAIISSAYI
jgi:hypothetical protein